MNFTPEELEQRFSSLPDELRASILSSEFDEKIKDISLGHNLHIDAAGALFDEVILVAIGITKPENFKNELIGKLGLTTEELESLVSDVNEKIFKEIRQYMQTASEKEDGGVKFEKPILTEERLNYATQNIEGAQAMSGMPVRSVKIEAPSSAFSQDTQTEDSHAEREDLLKGIEDVPTTSTPQFNFAKEKEESIAKAPSIFESKMKGEFSIPQTKTEASEPSFLPELKKKSDDSYREPI